MAIIVFSLKYHKTADKVGDDSRKAVPQRDVILYGYSSDINYYTMDIKDVIMFDGFAKSPTSALRCILRHCSVRMGRRAHGARLREIRVRSFNLVPSALCLVPFVYASFLKICAPCIWSFLLCRPFSDFLRVYQ